MFDAPTDLPAFLSWLRETTERAWAALPSGERDGWQQGTRWSGGLTADQLASAEAFFGHPFPADFKLFLTTLHTTTLQPKGPRDGKRVPIFGFYDWVNGREALRSAMAAPIEGLMFDVEHNGLWLSEWGPKPEGAKERQALVRREASSSSPLIPIFGHRFLVARPPEPGNPVLSVKQGDVIVYGDDLRRYLLREFAELLEVPVDPPAKSLKPVRLWGWLS